VASIAQFHDVVDAWTDTEWDALERVGEVLEGADARGMTPSQVGRKARLDTVEARRLLDLLVAGVYAHTSGNRGWTHYHPGRRR